ncbi:unnamed protein product [Pylaiella littoralis]
MTTSCPICTRSVTAAAAARSGLPPVCPLAADWADEERMEFLTSHVAPGDINARNQIVSFWSKAVAHAYEQASSLSLDPDELVSTSLDWGGAAAPGLQLAMDDMMSSGRLIQRSEIEGGEAGFAKRFVAAPLLLLARMTGMGVVAGKSSARQNVSRDVLEALVEGILQFCQHLPPDERTVYLLAAGHTKPLGQPVGDTPPWCFDQLCRAAASAAAGSGTSAAAVGGGLSESKSDLMHRILSRVSKDDVTLLASYLVRTKRAVTDEEEGVMKVLARGGGRGGEAATVGKGAILETEKDLLRLRCTVASLEANASDLLQQIRRAQEDALRENRQGQKRAALVHLRRMKQFQAARDKRLSSLYTLEAALHQVKQLRLDKQVLKAHEAATSALKTCREAQGLTVERVEDTLDALAEEMAEQQAVGAALAQDVASGQDSFDEELAAELEALLRVEVDAAATTSATETVPAGTAASPSVSASAGAVVGGVGGAYSGVAAVGDVAGQLKAPVKSVAGASPPSTLGKVTPLPG